VLEDVTTKTRTKKKHSKAMTTFCFGLIPRKPGIHVLTSMKKKVQVFCLVALLGFLTYSFLTLHWASASDGEREVECLCITKEWVVPQRNYPSHTCNPCPEVCSLFLNSFYSSSGTCTVCVAYTISRTR
jgi:hypothetical protein